MVHFVGAGPGDPDLITLRGARLLAAADTVIYAGSLVNPALLSHVKPGCRVYNSAHMTLEDVIAAICKTEEAGGTTVRLHTGDPSMYGAIREQIDALGALGIACDVTPGVSSFSGAAAALQLEYTLPGISQSVILTRMAGRTPVPERERIAALAAHRATMVLFLSASLLEELTSELLLGGYAPDTPAAIVYKATWPEEQAYVCTVQTLAETAAAHGIDKTALILVGDVIRTGSYQRSKLYDPTFTTGYRQGKET